MKESKSFDKMLYRILATMLLLEELTHGLRPTSRRLATCWNPPTPATTRSFGQKSHHARQLDPSSGEGSHYFRPDVSLQMSSREEEIAKLEAQLRQLKQEADDMPDDVISPAKRARINRALEKVRGKDMLLSEQEVMNIMKDDDDLDAQRKPSDNAVLLQALAALGVLALLLVFAQVPVGQESYQKYSATGSSTIQKIDLGDLNRDIIR